MKLIRRVLMPIALFIDLYNAAGQVSFAPAATYNVTDTPTCVIAADVNGDGKVDLITADGYYGTLTVNTNDGSGGFDFSATYLNYFFTYPQSVVAADLNGDGKVDLISVATYNILTILTNNGNGIFGSNATLNVGGFPYCVVAADINGDSKLDLITANLGDDSLTVLTNDGSGNFSLSATLQLTRGVATIGVVAADVNGDGKLDLICANQNANTLTVFTNNGRGVFGSSADDTYNVGLAPYSVTAVDVKGDGKVSLISANSGTNTLTVLTNDGRGHFGFHTTINVGNGPRSVVAADVNGDGKIDLICANFSSSTLTVLTNNGCDDFGSNSTIQLFAVSEATSVASADVNGDGKMDIICVSDYANLLNVFFNTSIFPPPTSTPSLRIKPISNGTIVSWPSASAGWSLQQNPDLTTSNWSPSGYSGYSISDDGTNKSLTITPSLGNLFFRLLHP